MRTLIQGAANHTPPTWNGPSSNWEGSSAGRNYGGTGFEDENDSTPSPPPWPLPRDPLVFDLDDDGVELIPLAESSVFFNMDDDPAAENVAWVGADDGLLVLDANANGQIDDLSELFGNATTSGFTELATLNSDGNGVINSADAQFSALRIWRDTDGDGVSDAGELHALSEFGITSINLAYQACTDWQPSYLFPARHG